VRIGRSPARPGGEAARGCRFETDYARIGMTARTFQLHMQTARRASKPARPNGDRTKHTSSRIELVAQGCMWSSKEAGGRELDADSRLSLVTFASVLTQGVVVLLDLLNSVR
jgi:hypothetical protein